jgi:hypothetical protein
MLTRTLLVGFLFVTRYLYYLKLIDCFFKKFHLLQAFDHVPILDIDKVPFLHLTKSFCFKTLMKVFFPNIDASLSLQ